MPTNYLVAFGARISGAQRYVGNVNLAVEAGNAMKTETRENLAYSCGSYISDRYLDLMRADCLARCRNRLSGVLWIL